MTIRNIEIIFSCDIFKIENFIDIEFIYKDTSLIIINSNAGIKIAKLKPSKQLPTNKSKEE